MSAKPNLPGRQPAHIEQRGGKSNRQRIWEAIRNSTAKRFTINDIAKRAKVNGDTVRTYFKSLEKAGFIQDLNERQGRFGLWSMKKDNGLEAPQLKRDGSPSTVGLGTEAMWRTLRILGSTTVSELATHASASATTTLETAARYLRWLERAGYVRSDGNRPARYHLIKSRVTGPRPPQIQRVGQVYDPNTAKVVYAQNPEELL